MHTSHSRKDNYASLPDCSVEAILNEDNWYQVFGLDEKVIKNMRASDAIATIKLIYMEMAEKILNDLSAPSLPKKLPTSVSISNDLRQENIDSQLLYLKQVVQAQEILKIGLAVVMNEIEEHALQNADIKNSNLIDSSEKMGQKIGEELNRRKSYASEIETTQKKLKKLLEHSTEWMNAKSRLNAGITAYVPFGWMSAVPASQAFHQDLQNSFKTYNEKYLNLSDGFYSDCNNNLAQLNEQGHSLLTDFKQRIQSAMQEKNLDRFYFKSCEIVLFEENQTFNYTASKLRMSFLTHVKTEIDTYHQKNSRKNIGVILIEDEFKKLMTKLKCIKNENDQDLLVSCKLTDQFYYFMCDIVNLKANEYSYRRSDVAKIFYTSLFQGIEENETLIESEINLMENEFIPDAQVTTLINGLFLSFQNQIDDLTQNLDSTPIQALQLKI